MSASYDTAIQLEHSSTIACTRAIQLFSAQHHLRQRAAAVDAEQPDLNSYHTDYLQEESEQCPNPNEQPMVHGSRRLNLIWWSPNRSAWARSYCRIEIPIGSRGV